MSIWKSHAVQKQQYTKFSKSLIRLCEDCCTRETSRLVLLSTPTMVKNISCPTCTKNYPDDAQGRKAIGSHFSNYHSIQITILRQSISIFFGITYFTYLVILQQTMNLKKLEYVVGTQIVSSSVTFRIVHSLP